MVETLSQLNQLRGPMLIFSRFTSESLQELGLRWLRPLHRMLDGQIPKDLLYGQLATVRVMLQVS